MAAFTFQSVIKIASLTLAIPATLYFGIFGLVATIPAFQTHAFYLHRVTLTWFKDLNVPETFGFLQIQVTPFSIEVSDRKNLHAWHILPLGVYRRNQQKLLEQSSGFAPNITSRCAFKLLRDDPEARLVFYLHGTAGTIGSGWRPDSYRALYSGAPDKIHVVTLDCRGYGLSSWTPSEEGLLIDAISLVKWATEVANILPSRIVTAVAISTSLHFASQSPPVSFAGMVLVASSSDIGTLLGTYRIGGVVPVLSPLARIPRLHAFFTGFLSNTWLSKDRIAEFVKHNENDIGVEKYDITFIHAEDDTDIPCVHTEGVFWHAINATFPTGISYEDLEREKELKKKDLVAGGWAVEWQTKRGVIREEIGGAASMKRSWHIP